MERREDRIGGYLESDIMCCVGKNKELYLRRFRDITSGRMTFNFSAAFFGNYWMAYRLMLIEAAILTVLDCAISVYVPLLLERELAVVEWSYGFTPIVFLLMGAVHILFMGFFGDRFYWWHVKRLLNSYQCKDTPGDTAREAELRQRGGTSAIIIVIFLFLQITLTMIFEKIMIL